MEKEIRHGKNSQLHELGESCNITDEILEKFLILNMKHIGLSRGKDQDEDVSLISWIASKKFIYAISLFHKLGLIDMNKPSVMPYIFNVVNENSLRISQPQRFKGVLYPPQAALIKRMLDIEESPLVFKLSNSTVTYSGGIVSERLSFGKTFCIPALICAKPVINSSIQPIPNTKLTESIYKNIISTNLVICGTKTAKEWKNNLKNFTSLSFIIIERVGDLDSLLQILDKQEALEVLVVKDGDITWKGKKDKAISHTLALYKDKTFTRVFLDDYDMLNLRDLTPPDALFTWFISGSISASSSLRFYCWDETGAKINMKNCYPILDAVSSVSCNKEYSVVEYNIPKINEHYFNSDNLFEFICNIVNNNPIDELIYDDDEAVQGKIIISDKLLTGTKDVPYVYDRSTLKMLVATESKDAQKSIVSALNNVGIKAIKLTRANVNKFGREDATVCVCGNLFGVNMAFLTHIVVCVNDFIPSACTQIIGRGQRLSRTQNLQVYMYEGY